MRPIHFMLLFWGERYGEYLTHWLHSMLHPTNLPRLDRADGHKIFLACPREDWIIFHRHALAFEARKHVDFIHVNIEPPFGPDDEKRSQAVRHQNENFVELLSAAYDPRAYGSMHSPDCIISPGLVTTLLRAINRQHDLVICPALRQSEEDVFRLESEVGPMEDHRTRAALWVATLHREVTPFVHPIHPQHTHAPFRMYAVETGMILHTFFGLAVLIDFAKVSNTWARGNIDMCLRTDAYANCTNVLYVDDSDMASIISLTPADAKNVHEFPPMRYSAWRDLANIRTAVAFHATDRIRREMFFRPMRIHFHPIDTQWRMWEWATQAWLRLAANDHRTKGHAAGWRKLIFDYIPQHRITRGIARRIWA